MYEIPYHHSIETISIRCMGILPRQYMCAAYISSKSAFETVFYPKGRCPEEQTEIMCMHEQNIGEYGIVSVKTGPEEMSYV